MLILTLLAAAPPEPPADGTSIGMLLIWVGALVAAFLLVLAIVRRQRPPAPPAEWQTTPDPSVGEPPITPIGHVAEALPSAFGPPAPEVVDEPATAPQVEEPLLPAIPRSSTEWMEGDELEGVDVPVEGAPRPVAELIEDLRTGEPSLCDAAIRDLTRHGQAAVPALEQALHDDDPDVRVDAARALAAIKNAGR